jgi:class 3 adenylate cyclase
VAVTVAVTIAIRVARELDARPPDLLAAVLEVAAGRRFPDGGPVRLRIGIDSGPVVAGVIGRRKFS